MEQYPDSANAQVWLAQACMAAGQREAAIQASTRAVAIDPCNAIARETLRWKIGI